MWQRRWWGGNLLRSGDMEAPPFIFHRMNGTACIPCSSSYLPPSSPLKGTRVRGVVATHLLCVTTNSHREQSVIWCLISVKHINLLPQLDFVDHISLSHHKRKQPLPTQHLVLLMAGEQWTPNSTEILLSGEKMRGPGWIEKRQKDREGTGDRTADFQSPVCHVKALIVAGAVKPSSMIVATPHSAPL